MKRFVALTLAVFAVPLTARQQSAQPPPTFRAATDIVEVDVVAQDKSGRFVTDLKPEDFSVRDEGVPQTLDVFYFIQGNAIVPASADASRELPLTPAVAAARGPRIFIAFFDDTPLTPGGFKRFQAAALALFSKQFRDGDVGGVVVRGTMANNRLTTVREELLASVRNAKTSARSTSGLLEEQSWPRISEIESVRIIVNSDEPVFNAVYQRACADDVDACAKMDVRGLVREKARMITDRSRAVTDATLRSLTGLMNGLTRIDGRKSVLLLSQGFLAEDSWPLVQQATALAARANARIYTLDARGLDRQRMGDHLTGVDPGTDDALARLFNQFDMGADSVNSLAVDTGGFVVRNQNIFDEAIDQIAADASTYYVLGFRPGTAPDGKFRTLSVSVNRPGVIVRARRGYVATPRPVSTSTASADPTRGSTEESGRSGVASAAAEGRTAEPAPAEATATVVPRTRPDASKHVETLAPAGGGDADAAAGWSAYQRGDVAAAQTSLLRAAARSTAPPWVSYALGQSQYALQQFSDASASWERVRSLVPEFKPVYFDLVDAYLQLKDYDKAMRVLRDGEKRWRRDAELLNALGVVQVTRGALDDAVQSFEEAVKSAPADPVGYFNLGKACELRYWKFRRYVSQTRQWMANGSDRNKAIDNYKRYLEIGGPLENAARDGLSRLDWSTPR